MPATIGIGIDASGAASIAALSKALTDVSSAASAAGKDTATLSRSHADLVDVTKNAAAALSNLAGAYKQATGGLGAFSAAMGSFKSYNNDVNAASKGLKAVTDQLRAMGATATATMAQYNGLVTGQSGFATFAEKSAGASYDLSVAMRAQAGAIDLVNKADARYVAMQAERIAADSAAYKAIMSKVSALGAEEKIAASRQALAQGANAALIASEEKLAAARTALAQGAAMAQIKAEERVAAARAALKQGNYAAQLNAEAAAHARAASAAELHARSMQTLHSLARGVSGAAGKLWLTYGNMAPMVAGFASLAVTMASVKKFGNFDDVAHSIKALSMNNGGLKQAVAGLREEMLSLKDVAHTPQELAEGVREFMRAGVSWEDAMGGISEVSKFATVGQIELSKAVELVVGQVNAFSGSGVTFSQAVNVIGLTADETSTSIEQMTESLKNTTSLGTVLKASFTDVAAAIGAMADRGIRGATAGTSLTHAMLRLITPTEAAKKAMHEAGVSFSMLDKNTGGIKSIRSAMDELAKSTEKLSTIKQVQLFEKMGGRYGMKAIGALVDASREGKKSAQQLFDTLEKGSKPATDAMSYLGASFAELAKGAKLQFTMLKADMDKAMIRSVSEFTVIQTLAALRDIVNDPLFGTGLAVIVNGLMAIVAVPVAAIWGIVSAVGSLREALAVEQTGDVGSLVSKKTVENTQKIYDDLVAQQKSFRENMSSLSDSEFYSMPEVASNEKAIETARRNLEYTKSLVAESEAAKKSIEGTGSSAKQKLAELPESAQQYAKILGEAGTTAARNSMKEMDQINADIQDRVDEMREGLMANAEHLFPENLGDAKGLEAAVNAQLKEYEANLRAGEFAQRIATAAKKEDKEATAAAREARSAEAAAMREQKSALQELTAGMDVYLAGVDRIVKETNTWSDAARKSAEGVQGLYDKYATAGMSEVEKLMYDRNKTLTEGAEAVAQYEGQLSDAAARVSTLAAAHEEAKQKLVEYQQALANNTAGGPNKDAKAYQDLQERVDSTAEAYRKALAAQIILSSKTDVSREALAKMKLELTGTREAYNEWANAMADSLEKQNSFMGGLQAGALRLSAQYNTLGKLGAKAFDMITDSMDDFARRSSDVLFDAMTGHLDDAEEEVKASYEQNMKDLQAAYNKGEMTVEEFEKERVALTEQYNKDIAEAHRSLWDEISGIAGDVWMSLLKALLQEFIAWIAKVAAAWAAANIFGDGDWSMPSFGGGGGGGWSFGSGGGSDYASWGTAAIGAGSAAYEWLKDDNIGSGNTSYTDTYGYGSEGGTYNINNAYINGVNTDKQFDYGSQDASNYGSAAFTGVKEGYNYLNPSVGAPTAMQTAGAGLGAVGGAYGLYSAYNQLQNGTANAGTAIQAGMSIYSLYKSYQTLSAAYEAYTAGSAAIEAGTIVIQGVEGAPLVAATDATAIGAQSAAAGSAVAAEGGAGAAGASAGVSAGTAATGFGVALGAVMMTAAAMNNHAYEQYTSPTLGIPVVMRDYGWDQQYDVKQFQGNTTGAWMQTSGMAYNGGDSRVYGESGVEGLSAEDMEIGFSAFKDMAMGTLDILANDFGDGLAQLALGLDGTVASTDRMVDAAAGFDVSMETSANMMALAGEAANGNEQAMQSLYDALGAVGVTGQNAETAVMGMVLAADMAAGAANSAAGAVDNMTASVQQLSSTPLRIAVNVDMGDFNAEAYGRTREDIVGNTGQSRSAHAVGGIFSGPTLLRSRNGYSHLVGEAGAEAIIPLRNTKQINTIEDDVAALRSEIKAMREQPIQNHFYVNGKQIATSIMPEVDKHVVTKNQRGLAGTRVY